MPKEIRFSFDRCVGPHKKCKCKEPAECVHAQTCRDRTRKLGPIIMSKLRSHELKSSVFRVLMYVDTNAEHVFYCQLWMRISRLFCACQRNFESGDLSVFLVLNVNDITIDWSSQRFCVLLKRRYYERKQGVCRYFKGVTVSV